MRFEGKVYIITGAGSGIGRAIAHRLTREGASVVIGDINERAAHRVAQEIGEAGGRGQGIHIDVRSETDAEKLVQSAIDSFGRLDGAVNNAGLGQLPARMADCSTDQWNKIVGVVLTGTFFGMRAQLRHFLQAGGGAIVNIASVAGIRTGEGQSPYVAAKHGVIGLTKQAAIEYVRDNIRVNAVAPGLVDTPVNAVLPEAQKAAIQPGGFPAKPDEIANVVTFLLSDEASFVSGSTYVADYAAMWKS